MFLAAALAPLGSTMIAVALPSISSELNVPGGALTQWLVASYLVAGIVAMAVSPIFGSSVSATLWLALCVFFGSAGAARADVGGALFSHVKDALVGVVDRVDVEPRGQVRERQA